MSEPLLIKCPFCGEDDFDLVGLKIHLMNGHCEEYGPLAMWTDDTDTSKDGG